MGILDDAIKEHLELKRQHGAGEAELKQLEDEAFGAAERPGADGAPADLLAEAPTQFMSQPDLGEVTPEVAEPPPADEASARRRPAAEIADLQEPPMPPEPTPEAEAPPEPEAPAEEPSPAMEQAIPEPPAGPSTEEREAIAEQPTEMYDVEEELAGGEVQGPSEEELAEEEISEPRLAPVDLLSAMDEVEEAELNHDDFFDEKRLSDELDQALEAPAEDEVELEPGEEPAVEAPPPADREEDVLEETPDFLEETPEDDQLWFEQKPPKDFDFDD
jgi:hypothetical protein